MSEELPDYICPFCGICKVEERTRLGNYHVHKCKKENIVSTSNTIKLRNRIHALEGAIRALYEPVENLFDEVRIKP